MTETTHRPSPEGEAGDKPEINPFLRMALDFGPLLAFVFANGRGEWLGETVPLLGRLGEPIFIATAVFMVATVISLAISWVLTRTLSMMLLVSGVIVIGTCVLTIWLNDEFFVKIEPTIVSSLIGLTLLVGIYVFRVSLLRYVFDAAFKLDEEGWTKLTVRWGLFMLALAALNEVVWRNFSTDFWVGFKVWGIIPITLVFTFSQMPLLMRHSLEKDDE